MPLPSVPPLDHVTICNFFGVPVTTPLSAFLRGAGIVPDYPANANVPTALPISRLQLLGADNVAPSSIDLQDASADAITLSPADATASLSIENSGQVRQAINNAPSTFLYNWLGAGLASAWEFRATVQSGGLSGGSATGVWLNGGGSSMSWFLTRTNNAAGGASCTLLIEGRPAGGGAVVDSALFNLSVTVEP